MAVGRCAVPIADSATVLLNGYAPRDAMVCATALCDAMQSKPLCVG
jgi:hypothetical protein